MTDPSPLVDLAEQCMRRVVKAEWVEPGVAHPYYCATLECGHHAHPSEQFLRSEILCHLCLKEKLAGGDGLILDAHKHDHLHGEDFYKWKPGMPYRWYVTNQEFVGGGMRHIIKRKRGRGTPDLLCNSFVTGYEVLDDGGKPCKRCLQRAAHLKGET